MNSALQAAVDFVRDNPDGLESISGLDIATAIVTVLHRQGHLTPYDLITRVSKHEGRNTLLEVLHMHYRGSNTNTVDKFYKELLGINWLDLEDMGFEYVTVQGVANNVACACIAYRDTAVFDDPEHWAYELLIDKVDQGFIDIEWTNRVRRFLCRREYRRAFDEVKRAWHGHPIQPFEIKRPKYRHAASPDKVTQLVGEVYEDMVAGKLLPPVTEADLTYWSFMNPQEHYMMGSHKRRPFTTHHSLPGLEFACCFISQQPQGRRKTEAGDQFVTPCIFVPEGVMVLRLCEYFQRDRNQRRRREYEQALADYNAKHK